MRQSIEHTALAGNHMCGRDHSPSPRSKLPRDGTLVADRTPESGSDREAIGEGIMRQNSLKTTWVVYRNNHKTLPANATCTQREWERLEQEEPGLHTLIQAG